MSYPNDGMELLALSAGRNHNCVVRCDRAVLCFGEGANGELGVPGLAANQPSPASLSPIPFSPSSIVLVPVAITSVTLSTSETIAVTYCRLVYIAWAVDIDSVSVTAVTATPGSSVTVNGGLMSSTTVPLFRHIINAIVIKATLGAASVEVLINVRFLSSYSIALMASTGCVLLSHRVACFGVRMNRNKTFSAYLTSIFRLFLSLFLSLYSPLSLPVSLTFPHLSLEYFFSIIQEFFGRDPGPRNNESCPANQRHVHYAFRVAQ
jgi:hypothetical protein